MLDALLRRITSKRKYVRKSKMTSGNEYKIFISHNGHWAWFSFHDNHENKSTLRDWLYCLMLDMDAFMYSRDEYDFARNFGYADEDISKARKVYRECEKVAEKMHRLFTTEELELLSTIE